MEDTQNNSTLAPRITRDTVKFRVMAKLPTAAAIPQYQNSALNPSIHWARRPDDGMRGDKAGHKRGTAFR